MKIRLNLNFINQKEEPSHPRFASKEYRDTRRWYFAQCAFAYLAILTISDTFLAKFLHYEGISDAVIGIINSILTFSYIFSAGELLLIPHVKNLKKTVVIGRIFSYVFLLPLYLIPFLPVSKTVQIVLIILCVLGNGFCRYVTEDFFTKWIYYFVDPKGRSFFTTWNCSISYFTSAVYLLICGFIVDHFEEKGKLEIAFLCLTGLIFIMAVGTFISFAKIKNAPLLEGETVGKTLQQTFSYTLHNKSLLRFFLLFMLATVPDALVIGFLGTYKTQELGISVGMIQVFNTGVVLLEGALSSVFGRYADKTSPMHCYRIGLSVKLVSYLILIFTVPKTWWLMILYMFVYGFSVASYGGSSTTLCFEYISQDFLVQCLALKLCITGILGFLVSLLGAKILAAVQQNGFNLFGISLYGQQVLAIIGSVFIILTYFYTRRVEKKRNIAEIEGNGI